MRKSNTEPIVRIFSESDTQIKADKIALGYWERNKWPS